MISQIDWNIFGSHVHNAPFNEIEITNEDGDIITVCGCTSCQRARREEARAEAEYERRKAA